MDTRIPELVAEADRGDRSSADALFVALYEKLHRKAKRELARCGPDVALGATTLLHEAYLDISGREGASFPDRARFMAYAARVMRGLIIDYARNRQAQKRGSNFELVPISSDIALSLPDSRELQRLADSLDELAEADPELAEVVDLKFFCGFTFDEIAAMRGVAKRTIQRQWEKARIYLHRAIGDQTSFG